MGENPRSRLIESNQVESRKSRTFADARPQEQSDAEISGPLAMATSLQSASSRFDLLVSAHREDAWSVHPLWFNGSLLEREECESIARGAMAKSGTLSDRAPRLLQAAGLGGPMEGNPSGGGWRGLRSRPSLPGGGPTMKNGSRALNLSAQTIVVSSPNDF